MDSTRTLEQTEAARTERKAELASTQCELADAQTRNLEGYRMNEDVLAEFDKEGPSDGLLRKEPLIGFLRVEIETLVQEYEYKMGDHLRDSTIKQLAAPPGP